jgi:SWI/SNF-related matrix-associated actin-dependent regulator of chromatin subfamily A3
MSVSGSSEAKGALIEYQEKSTVGQQGRFQNVLERLLRLRQMWVSLQLPGVHITDFLFLLRCNHWTLCKERINDLLKLLEDQDVVVLNDKNRAILQQALQLYIESQEDCAVCLDTLSSPVITHCKHVFCKPCITKVIEVQHKCPMCRNKLEAESLLEPAVEKSNGDEDFDTDSKSSKTEALLKILKATLKDDVSKVVIFSQWTSFLDIIQHQLIGVGYNFTRIDGSMSADKRDAAIHALDNDPNTRIMLASLSVCSVGLNLVSADTVVLADSCTFNLRGFVSFH